VSVIVSPVPKDKVARRLILSWENATPVSGDWIGLFDREPAIGSEPLYVVKPQDSSGWVETESHETPSPSHNLGYSKKCLGFWAAYVSGDSILASSCLQTEPTWMSDLERELSPLMLRQIFLTGTHDAGSYEEYDPSTEDNLITKYTITQVRASVVDSNCYHTSSISLYNYECISANFSVIGSGYVSMLVVQECHWQLAAMAHFKFALDRLLKLLVIYFILPLTSLKGSVLLFLLLRKVMLIKEAYFSDIPVMLNGDCCFHINCCKYHNNIVWSPAVGSTVATFFSHNSCPSPPCLPLHLPLKAEANMQIFL
jgi:hypothetical protein